MRSNRKSLELYTNEELDIQQSQISITLGQQITTAASMEELLLKWMEKTKTEHKLLKQHRKKLAETNDTLTQGIIQASDLLAQIKEEEQQIQGRGTTNLGTTCATRHQHGQGTQDGIQQHAGTGKDPQPCHIRSKVSEGPGTYSENRNDNLPEIHKQYYRRI
jgi:hypothetical protein